MASAKILNKPIGTTKSVFTSDDPEIEIVDKSSKYEIIRQDFDTVSVIEKDALIAKIQKADYSSSVKDFLPFRVKFINIGIEGYGPNNVPPIGIAIIGINNYIL